MDHKLEKAVRTTTRSTMGGEIFTTHQRDDLRWIYRIDGVASTKAYPTAGEAERGALATLQDAIKTRQDRAWKSKVILAMLLVPVVYVVLSVLRLLLG